MDGWMRERVRWLQLCCDATATASADAVPRCFCWFGCSEFAWKKGLKASCVCLVQSTTEGALCRVRPCSRACALIISSPVCPQSQRNAALQSNHHSIIIPACTLSSSFTSVRVALNLSPTQRPKALRCCRCVTEALVITSHATGAA